ncbi:hemerythrin domain-containing protein [Pandoraea sp.]|uniref:hemerythrin domain-containing protein n=1 Tax=Pandoraea sp. TaxID=1883445 RepID=UPI0012041CCC|nr:hemerythrin domain-containing protein [Pandoraea sp.]TAL54600.1 MAG: hemerythrin domain-containing protein [Pandoraea sp.]TAM17626.1 MAG: hemerythrin domain-containing protein [Pandoraea sp.]
MTNIVDTLRAEHGNLERLIRLFDDQAIAIQGASPASTALLVDATYYLTRFPDVNHHTLEDRIVESLLKKRALPVALGREIEAQHATLVREGHQLLQALESLIREENSSAEWVEFQLRLYGERLRHNIAMEELTLFPMALARLDADDWDAIVRGGPTPSADPLFQTPVHERFRQLHRIIAREAECGCEDDDFPRPIPH